MVSISAVALGISFLTTSLLTIHDTAKQVEHAKGFATFLLTQDLQSNAQYALTCVTTAIEERVTSKGEEVRKNIMDASADFLNQSLAGLQLEIDRKLKSLSISSLISFVREEEEKINQDNIAIKAKENQVIGAPDSPQSSSIFQKLANLKSSISHEIGRQLELYQSARRAKQKKAILYLYDIYKESQGLKNNKWITPYNIVMMILLGIGSFLIPKIVIGLALSYFLAAETYLLTDTISQATGGQAQEGLDFDHIFEFHLMVFATSLGLNRYEAYRGGEKGVRVEKQRRLSSSY